MRRLNDWFGRLLEAFAMLGCALLFFMLAVICADVALRSLRWGGMGWATEVSEYILYGSTFMAAPHLLRRGRHVRLDLVLRVIPPRIGWVVEWVVDLVGFMVCTTLTVAGTRIMLASHANGNVVQKTINFAEWLLLVPVPVTFCLLAVEFLFRMFRLASAPHTIRDEANSVA